MLLFVVSACSSEPHVTRDDPCDAEEVECDPGICEDRDGQARCLCPRDYHVEGVSCVADPEECTDSFCSGHGTCDDSAGEPVCNSCDEGYAGDNCEQCDQGYHRIEGSTSGSVGDCVPDVVEDPCHPDPCDDSECGYGTCVCVDGEAICDCEAGYTGAHCDECADDYHEIEGEEGCFACNEMLFEFEAFAAETVWLTGSWIGWPDTVADGVLQMTETPDGSGTWRVITTIETSGHVEYKYIVDGMDWRYDPTEPTVGEGVYTNNVVEVCIPPPVGECGDVEVRDWRDVVLYFVMIDRFYDSDGASDPVPGAFDGPSDGSSGQYEGGDLAGVTARLDYLSELGVSAIWLSAPYENRNSAGAGMNDDFNYSGYHGYWPSPPDIDYGDIENPVPRPQTESRIGSDADLREFVTTAHHTMSANGEGIQILFDYVMNHIDIESSLYAAHEDWFARHDGRFVICGECNADLGCGCGDGQPSCWDDSYWGTRCAFTPYLPPFDFTNPDARSWSVADAIWWAREYNIDGYRLDAIKHVPLEWLEDIRSALTAEFTEPWGNRFYLVGETFAYDGADLIRSFIDPETMLDGQFDFPFKKRLCQALFNQEMGLDSFSAWMDGNDIYYGQDAIMTTWIGNHDIPRAIHFASGQIADCAQGSGGLGWDASSFRQPPDAPPYERLGLSFVVMMTNRGIPLIYYGDEIGLAGGGDPDNRRMMIFDDAYLNEHQIALRENVRALAHIRAENSALSRGTRSTHQVDADTWVYTMGGCEETSAITVAINRADESRFVVLPEGSYLDLMTEADHRGGATELGPRSFLILRHEE